MHFVVHNTLGSLYGQNVQVWSLMLNLSSLFDEGPYILKYNVNTQGSLFIEICGRNTELQALKRER